jgi:uncharacterized LabA/DUF88 family protein
MEIEMQDELQNRTAQQTAQAATPETDKIRAAIFIDVEYFRIACGAWSYDEKSVLRNTSEFIDAVKMSAPAGSFDGVGRWKCFAYDAVYRWECKPFVTEEELRHRTAIHEQLAKGGFRLQLGQFVVKKNGTPSATIVQKGVDTKLVIDAMREAAFGSTKLFIFVTGDSDFLPLIQELRAMRKDVVLLYGDLRSINSKLLMSATASFPLVTKEEVSL